VTTFTVSGIGLRFGGTCTDCAGGVTGTLLLNGTLAADLGQPIASNFVSFTYNGSNLLAPFTINPGSPGFSISGTLQVSPTIPAFTIADTANNFKLQSDGTWCAGTTTACTIASADQGTSGSLSTPEPGTGSTAILGAAGLAGWFLRRRFSRVAGRTAVA